MRIGIDIRPLVSGIKTGVGEYTYGLVDALLSLGADHEYILFCNAFKGPSPNIPSHWSAKSFVHLVSKRIPNKCLNGMIATTGRPRLDRLAGPKLDIFFSPNIHFTSVSPETAHAITIHDLSFEHLPNCYTQKQRLWHKSINPKKQCQQADIIITPSEHTKRDVAKTYGIPESKMTAIHPGLAPGFALEDLQGMDRVRNTYGLRQRYILFLGTLEPRKNITTAIDAFVDSGLRSRGYELIIAGAHGWHTRPILQNIQRTDGVRHIGYVRSEDKPALYRLADVFVYPSLYEGFGFPVLEAMASGTPVITSHRASLPEVGGNAVWYVNPMNTKEIATAMEAVVSDSTISELYMDRGRLQAKRFCWNRAARRCLSLFQTV